LDENKKLSLASISVKEIRSYYNIKYSGTKTLKEINKQLDSMTESDFRKLALAIAEDFRTDYYWTLIEIHFEQIFLNK